MTKISNQFYHELFESVSEGILVIDKNKELVYVNKAIITIFGYEKEELIGKNFEILLPDQIKQKHKKYTKTYFNDPSKRQMSDRDDIFGISKAGKRIDLNIGLNHFIDGDEKFITAIISDVSQDKKTNRFLKDLNSIVNDFEKTIKEKINLILVLGCNKFNLPIGILSSIEGDNYTIVEINADSDMKARIMDIYPYKIDNLLCSQVLNSEYPVHLKNISSEDNSIHPFYKDLKLKTYLGTKVIVDDKAYGTIHFTSQDSSTSVIPNSDLEILRLMAQWIGNMIRQDGLVNKLHQFNFKLEEKIASRTQELRHALTEIQEINISLKEEIKKRKEIEAKVIDSLEKERSLNELKSRFVSTASHEFRTPLTGILSSVTLIEKYADVSQQDKREKHINIIRSSVKNLTSILNDFLSLSKLESGIIKCEPHSFNLHDFMNEMIEELSPTLKEGQNILFSPTNIESPILYQDDRFLKNVLYNLVSNASKYSDIKQNIVIETKIDDKLATIVIKDNGIGIPAVEQPHLFHQFFRASNAISYQGTGLGLNITQKYVALMQGTIIYESEENIGTTFTVTIPVSL